MDAFITVSGNLGTDVDYRATDTFSRASFRIASTPRIRRADEWVDGHTTWVNVECGNRLADNARDSLVKGDPVVVFGRLRTKIWESGGTKHERMVIEASSIGHDLTRGTSQFTRSLSARQTDDPVQAGDGMADGNLSELPEQLPA
ncbi:MAG: single-stranded DNA-binding protein [Propionibacterium sp.]|nr:single-stranded DNA-binding protein [Propionibacterium sp.]